MKWMQVKTLLEYFEHHSIDEFKDFIDHIDSQNEERNINEDNYAPHQLALIEFMEFFSQFETLLADEGMMNTFFTHYTLIDEKDIPPEHKNKRLYVIFRDGVTNLKRDIERFLKSITNSNEEQKVHPKLQKVINNIYQSIQMIDRIQSFEPAQYQSHFAFGEQDKEKAQSWIKQILSFYSQLQTTSPEDYGLTKASTEYLQDIIDRISRTDGILNIKSNNKLLVNFKMLNQYRLGDVFIDKLRINMCYDLPTINKQYKAIREQIRSKLNTFNFYDIADEVEHGDFSRVIPVESEMTRAQSEIFREIEQLLLDMAELFDLQ